MHSIRRGGSSVSTVLYVGRSFLPETALSIKSTLALRKNSSTRDSVSNKGVQGSRIPSEVHGTVGHGPSAPTTPPIVDRRSFLLILFRRLGGGDGASSSSSFSSQSSMGASAGSTCLTRARLCCIRVAPGTRRRLRGRRRPARGGSEPWLLCHAARAMLCTATPRGGAWSTQQ